MKNSQKSSLFFLFLITPVHFTQCKLNYKANEIAKFQDNNKQNPTNNKKTENDQKNIPINIQIDSMVNTKNKQKNWSPTAQIGLVVLAHVAFGIVFCYK